MTKTMKKKGEEALMLLADQPDAIRQGRLDRKRSFSPSHMITWPRPMLELLLNVKLEKYIIGHVFLSLNVVFIFLNFHALFFNFSGIYVFGFLKIFAISFIKNVWDL